MAPGKDVMMAGVVGSSCISDDFDGVRRRHLAWVQDFRLVRSGPKLAQYQRWGIAELAARLYSDATGRDLDVAADALGWFTLLDDQFDGPRRFRTAGVLGMREELLNHLTGQETRVSDVPLVGAWADLCPRMLAGMSASWAARAAGCWGDHFDACAAEGCLPAGGPDAIGQYLAVRRISVGGYLGTILLERVLCCELPPTVWESPQIAAIRQAVADMAVFLNDISSADREVARGDQVNLVIVLGDRLGCSHAVAVADMHRRARGSMRLIRAHQRELLAMCPQLGLTDREQAVVRRYLTGTGRIVTGLRCWYATTGRYAGPEISDGGIFGFEDLLSPLAR
jgi:hypothetical protein